ncbi:MAG: endonuclease III [Candidatus ainarchaeum sp.]|nr:endonuclease III [Candidatus ainarchaeum sp.]
MGEKELLQLNELKKYSVKMRLAGENWDAEWKILVTIIMSAQSRDEITIKIAKNLFEKYDSLEKLSKAKYKSVLNIFKSLNYNKTKTKHIIACSKIIFEEYNSIPPHDFDKLISLPGVGRKTANVFLSEVGKSAIGVDTHVFYISRKLGWTKNKDIKKIETDLKNIFPKKKWSSINQILVRFGKTNTSKKKKDLLLEKIRKI